MRERRRIVLTAALAMSVAACVLTTADRGIAKEILQGFGKDVPLSFAVRQIVPSGHEISYGAGVDVEAPVTWRGGRAWHEVLEDLARSRGLTVTRRGRDVRLTVGPKPADGPGPGPVAIGGAGFSIVPYRGPARVDEVVEVAAAEAEVAEPIQLQPLTPLETVPVMPPPTAPKLWEAEAGMTLRTVLEDWADRENWTLVWDSRYEYPIEAGAVFSGDFVDVATALISSMREARPIVTAKFYQGNRVLVIDNVSLDAVN